MATLFPYHFKHLVLFEGILSDLSDFYCISLLHTEVGYRLARALHKLENKTLLIFNIFLSKWMLSLQVRVSVRGQCWQCWHPTWVWVPVLATPPPRWLPANESGKGEDGPSAWASPLTFSHRRKLLAPSFGFVHVQLFGPFGEQPSRWKISISSYVSAIQINNKSWKMSIFEKSKILLFNVYMQSKHHWIACT